MNYFKKTAGEKNDGKKPKVVFKCLIRRQQEKKKKCPNNTELEALDLCNMSVLPFYHNQNSDYNDSSAVCIYVKKIFPGNVKTMKFINKVPKKTVYF